MILKAIKFEAELRPQINNPIQISQMQEHLARIIQTVIAIPFLILTLTNWSYNQIGQNIINLTVVSIYLAGLDNIIILYRWIINQQSFEFQATFILICLLFLGTVFERFHPSENSSPQFNNVCHYNLLGVLILNGVFVLLAFFTLLIYMIRQIYRLMTQTLLSPNQHIQRQELDQIMNMRKIYEEIANENPAVNNTCSICLLEFQKQNLAIMLPGCEHCFHFECIQSWLQSKSTCPYCRNNIRLSLL